MVSEVKRVIVKLGNCRIKCAVFRYDDVRPTKNMCAALGMAYLRFLKKVRDEALMKRREHVLVISFDDSFLEVTC